MRSSECDFEKTIVHALQTDGVSASARAHLTECDSCRALVMSDVWMKDYARRPVPQVSLPDPSLIWITHQVLVTNGKLGEIGRALGRLETVAVSLIAVAWAALLTWKWEALSAFAESPASTLFSSALRSQLVSLPFLTSLVALVCASLLLAFRGALVDGAVDPRS